MSLRSVGMIFENAVHQQLLKTGYRVYREIEIRKQFGQYITAIDHMIIFNNVSVCIQDKFQNSKISIDKTSHFIQNVNSLSYKLNKKCIGIYLTKSNFSKPSKDAFHNENLINKNEFLILYGKNQEILIKKLSEYFYKNNAFMYDIDGDTIML